MGKKGSIRVEIEYHPPINNWIGFGLKILGEYEYNDERFACQNNQNEWAVAYHNVQKIEKLWSTEKEGTTEQKCKFV